MTELAAIITAATAMLIALGGGLKWLWTQLQTRFKAIDAKLALCEQRERDERKRGAVQLTVIELLWQETARLTPGRDSAVLQRARHLLESLRAALPVDTVLPPEIAALVRQLDDVA